MFIYFIAEKGFLPCGRRFLSEQLAANAEANGDDTFYTRFLLPLSFFGFGERQGERHDFEEQFKDVLYLNGGLFTVHTLEAELGISKEAVRTNTVPPQAKIPDAEFQHWFEYFDDWRWTLDEEKVENDGQISPHILGYIFEKYINQKQMGAYYTKEDITGYICRNTIIPRLFDMLAETGDQGKKAVDPLPVGPHPNLLNDGRGISDGEGIDRYVYASVKQEEKLPTETDFEQNQRRQRYERILNDFDEGKVSKIDDFITYNLDIEKLALDFVSNIQDPVVMHRLYFRCLRKITVLDPTCGSGAFLFAALGILYPLYNAALSRMQFLVGKATGKQPDVVNWDGRLHFDDLDVDQSTFADAVGTDEKIIGELLAEVERINDHPSAEYFIKKTVIVNNLFGVDIMEEAVEICKLRPFLSLISTVERDDRKPNLGVEPLPDIDFNIIAGNTLVGYSSIEDIDRLWHEVESGTTTKSGALPFFKDHSKLEKLVSEYVKLLGAWRLQQLGEWDGAPISKEQLTFAAGEVRRELDPDLWRLYKTAGLIKDKVTQSEFKKTHEPLHWLLEFPQIEASGGFQVIVGNPPYIEIRKILRDYSLTPYRTLSCGNLFAPCIERSVNLLHASGAFGMIVPITAASADGFSSLRECLVQKVTYWSNFDDRPSHLFDGLDKNTLSIILIREGRPYRKHASRLAKWSSTERATLFEQVSYQDVTEFHHLNCIAKVSQPIEVHLLMKLMSNTSIDKSFRANNPMIFYSRKVNSFLQVLDFVPQVKGSDGKLRAPSEFKSLAFADLKFAKAAFASYNSTLFRWYVDVYSDGSHLNRREVASFPFNPEELSEKHLDALNLLALQLTRVLQDTSEVRKMRYSHDTLSVQCIVPKNAKSIIDQIDTVLAQHFNFSDEELLFIVNYDIKYRMGIGNLEA